MVDRRTALRRVFPLTLIGLNIVVLVALFLVVSQRMNDLRQAPGDNLTWSLSQTEVDLLRLINETVARQNQGDTEFKELRRRFDNFHSRVTGIIEGPVFAPMRADPKFSSELRKLIDCLKFTTPLVDVPDKQLRENLEFILLGLNGVRIDVHDIALTGIALQSISSDAERRAFSNLLLIAAIVSFALILFLIVLLFFLLRQYRLQTNTAAEVERAKKRLESTFQASLDAIIVADDQGVILDFNQSAEAVFGFSKEEAVGAQMAELIIPPQYRDAHYAGMARFNKTHEPRLVGQGRIEITSIRKSGEEFPIELSIGQAQSHKGEIFISHLRDITERLAAEEDLKKARDDALKAEKSKSNFLAVMSHEMRTPLNGIFGTMELLKKTKLTEKQISYVDIARRSGDILLHHVNDVLDVSRLDEDKMVLKENSFDLEHFFRDILASNGPVAEKAGNRLELSFNNAPTGHVVMDEQRLRQVVYNLVSNAMKFTSDGTISINVSTKEKADSRHLLKFNVADDGVGIPPEEQARIFERFYTKEDVYDRMASGAGLGLTICKQIVDLMGGDISVESEVGHVTKFSVELPMSLPDASLKRLPKKTADVEDYDLSDVTVLLVEDNEINRMIVREMLQSEGLDVEEAHDGEQAVAMAAEKPYSVILMDISMPVMNGVDATIAIRASDNPNKNAPILALTAHAMDDEQAKFIDAGMNSCIDKPVSQTTLVQTLSEYVEQKDFSTSEGAELPASRLLNPEVFGGLKTILNSEKLNKLVVGLESEINSLIRDIPNLLKQENLLELAKLSHKSVGSTGMIGLQFYQKDLRALEQAAKAGDLVNAITFAGIVMENWPETLDALKKAL